MMRHLSILFTSFILTTSLPADPQHPLLTSSTNISLPLFVELEELSRIVDISYCVGTTGISSPFLCASRCADFPSFELVSTFNTGPLMSDSCGYIALDHGTQQTGTGRERKQRVIVAFRGTYSIANTIVDLSTVPQEYVPYPDNPGNETVSKLPDGRPRALTDLIPLPGWLGGDEPLVEAKQAEEPRPTCKNCTVHTGFWTSWQNTRPHILPHLEYVREKYPSYELHLVGHSLGGAVAALAALEFEGLGWHPYVTTFGEPRVGNAGLRDWIDGLFNLPSEHGSKSEMMGRYRRVTHVDDPVPLLPLQEWGYRAHAGEVFIAKAALQPAVSDVRLCYGDEDVDCIAGAEVDESWFNVVVNDPELDLDLEAPEDVKEQEESVMGEDGEVMVLKKRWGIPIPARYKMWQLFFAHRDYFWRLGLCVPGGDPLDWGRRRYDFGGGEGEERPDEL